MRGLGKRLKWQRLFGQLEGDVRWLGGEEEFPLLIMRTWKLRRVGARGSHVLPRVSSRKQTLSWLQDLKAGSPTKEAAAALLQHQNSAVLGSGLLTRLQPTQQLPRNPGLQTHRSYNKAQSISHPPGPAGELLNFGVYCHALQGCCRGTTSSF